MLRSEPYAWESRLLDWATEPLGSKPVSEPVLDGLEHILRPPALDRAYRFTEELTRRHSRTFFLASQLMPVEKRAAVRALYAFCRVSDDLVDASGNDADGLKSGDTARLSNGNNSTLSESLLEDWRWRSLYLKPEPADLVTLAWSDTRRRYRIPRLYAEQLIDGVKRDVHQKRYQTFEDLATYCYGVASTVGLMAMHIIGFSDHAAVPYAVKLGVALQLTNILRDVGEDWQKGRVYLPQEELESFGLSENHLAEAAETGEISSRWQSFMSFQIERNRALYAEALPGIAHLHPDGRFAIQAAADLYAGILDDIEVHAMNVFDRRAHVSSLGKLRRLPGIWLRAFRAAKV